MVAKVEKQYTCSFKLWDKEKGVMGECGQPAVYRYKKSGKKYVCAEHAKYVKKADLWPLPRNGNDRT